MMIAELRGVASTGVVALIDACERYDPLLLIGIEGADFGKIRLRSVGGFLRNRLEC
jgi:hypothetical protein